MALLIKGADFFVNGASAVAKKMKVPSIFIGLTVVALGTSLPELSVSLVSAVSGNIDISVGNVVGSNMFNILVVLGCVAIFAPISMNKATNKIDFPFMIAITGVFVLFGFDRILDGASKNMLSRSESVLLIILLALYLSILIFNANRTRKRKIKQDKYLQSKNVEIKPEEEEVKDLKIWQIVLYLGLGLGAVVFGGECVASTAEYLAIKMGMSEALVGITIVAFGTSLPELVTSIMAAKKGENDLALGNVVGSNIINISLILGSVGLIAQAPISSIILSDMVTLFISTIIFVFCCVQKAKISRSEGILFVSMYVAYLTFAIVRNYCF